MTMQQGNQPPHWQVTGQIETNRADDMGRFVSGVLVSYSTDSGITGSVFVPDRQYTVDNVKQAILARVASHDTVLNLKG